VNTIFSHHAVERFSSWILSVEKLLRECVIDNRNAGRGLASAEVAAVDEGNPHSV
jgi:hypothetical protein